MFLGAMKVCSIIYLMAQHIYREKQHDVVLFSMQCTGLYQQPYKW